MEQIKHVFKYLILITTTPEETWSYLANGGSKDADADEMNKQFYMPWLVIASAIILFFRVKDSYYADFNPEVMRSVSEGMREMVPFLVSYFAAPFVAVMLLREIYPLFMGMQIDKRRLEVLVCYSMSFVILTEVVCAILPHIKLLQFAAIYLVYIIWCGSSAFAGVTDSKRWQFTVSSTCLIWGLPTLLQMLLNTLIR